MEVLVALKSSSRRHEYSVRAALTVPGSCFDKLALWVPNDMPRNSNGEASGPESEVKINDVVQEHTISKIGEEVPVQSVAVKK